AAQIELLQHLVSVAHEHNLGVPLELKIKFNIVASLYDYNPNLAAYMKVRKGLKIGEKLGKILGKKLGNLGKKFGENRGKFG
ncbi:hypothetical protein HGM15179_021870, partial [Zosterops borbonicus]